MVITGKNCARFALSETKRGRLSEQTKSERNRRHFLVKTRRSETAPPKAWGTGLRSRFRASLDVLHVRAGGEDDIGR